MSISSLGEIAKCKTLIAGTVSVDAITRVVPVPDITTAGSLPIRGFHVIDPPANPTAYTLAAGAARGDTVEFLGFSGANEAVITPSNLHGVNTTVGITGGGYAKFIWTGTQWYIIGRCGAGAALPTAVANYPTLA